MMRRKIIYGLCSLVLATGFWLYVISVISPGFSDTVYNIPVVVDGESVLNERGLMLTGISNQTVSMTLSGNRSDVVRVNAQNTSVRVDLSKVYDAGTQIPLSYTPSFSGDINSSKILVENRNPAVIYVGVAKRVTKEIPVEVHWLGSAQDGYITDRENCVMDLTSVTISGPDKVADNIAKAVVEVDLTGRTESISEQFTYSLCDADGEPVDAQLITTNAESIRLEVKIRAVREIRLTYSVVDGGGATAADVTVTLSQSTIRVAGSEAALNDLGDSLNLGTLNLADIPKSGTVTMPIVLPEGMVNLTGATEVSVKVQFTGLSTKELTLTKITGTHIPENLEAEIITQSLTVTFRGPSELIENLSEYNVTVNVDLTDAQPGTSTYKATFAFAEGYSQVGALHSEPVSVSIKEK